VPSQPSATSPVSSSIFGDSVARYTGTETGGRATRIGLPPGSGIWWWLPENSTFSPEKVRRTIVTVSRMRPSG
jgi:hypothetical protein